MVLENGRRESASLGYIQKLPLAVHRAAGIPWLMAVVTTTSASVITLSSPLFFSPHDPEGSFKY